MADHHEWVHLSDEIVAADPHLTAAVDRFEAPDHPAGIAAQTWLRERALAQAGHTATYRAASAEVTAEAILAHAVGVARRAAAYAGAAVLALDPFDDEVDRFWRQRFGFRSSLSRRRDSTGLERTRLWLPLFPDDV